MVGYGSKFCHKSLRRLELCRKLWDYGMGQPLKALVEGEVVDTCIGLSGVYILYTVERTTETAKIANHYFSPHPTIIHNF